MSLIVLKNRTEMDCFGYSKRQAVNIVVANHERVTLYRKRVPIDKTMRTMRLITNYRK